MKKHHIFLLIFLGGMIFTACNENTDITEAPDLAVVECFLTPGKAPDTVKISNILSYSSEETDTEWISNLNVVLIHNEISYPLLESEAPGHYVCPENTLIIEEGETYRLEFEYNDKQLTAETIVPEIPREFNASDDTYYFPTMGSGGPGSMDDGIELTWSVEENITYYLKIENIETDPELAMEFMIEDDSTNMPETSRITQPSSDDFYTITMRNVSYLGTHRVILYAVTEDYARMNEQNSTSSISLTDPYTNVENGYGLFSAFATDTLYFEVE